MATKIVKTLRYPNDEHDYNINAVALGGKLPEEFKTIQTPKSSPATNGVAAAFIDSISQDANGVITATKKEISVTTDNIQPGTEVWLFDCGSATTVTA